MVAPHTSYRRWGCWRRRRSGCCSVDDFQGNGSPAFSGQHPVSSFCSVFPLLLQAFRGGSLGARVSLPHSRRGAAAALGPIPDAVTPPQGVGCRLHPPRVGGGEQPSVV